MNRERIRVRLKKPPIYRTVQPSAARTPTPTKRLLAELTTAVEEETQDTPFIPRTPSGDHVSQRPNSSNAGYDGLVELARSYSERASESCFTNSCVTGTATDALDAVVPATETATDDTPFRRSPSIAEDDVPTVESGELDEKSSVIVTDAKMAASADQTAESAGVPKNATYAAKNKKYTGYADHFDGLGVKGTRPSSTDPAESATELELKEPTTKEDAPKDSEAEELGTDKEGLEAESAESAEDLLQSEEIFEETPAAEELIAVDADGDATLAAQSPVDAGSGVDVAAWSDRVRTAVGSLRPASLPSAEQTTSSVKTAGSAVTTKWQGKPEQINQEATRVLEAKPLEPLPDIPPMPSPDPVPEATQKVASKSVRELPDQKLPDLVLTPHGIKPALGSLPGGTSVKPPAAAPPAVNTSAPVSKTPVEAINQAAANSPDLAPTVEPGQTIAGSERAPVYTIAAPSHAEIASVLAQVFVEAEASGRKVLQDARKLAYGVDLNARPGFATLGDDLIEGEKARFQDEMNRLAEAANIGKQAFDEAVTARTNQLTDLKTQADTRLVQTTGEQASLIDQFASSATSTIQSYHQSFGAYLDQVAAEAKGGVDPKEVRKEEERLKGLLRKHADEHIVAWDSMQKERHSKLDRALADQLSAYRAAALMDQRANAEAPVADLTDPELKKWLMDRSTEAARTVDGLKNDIKTLIESWRAEMRLARDEAVVMVGAWADERIGRERGWLEQLLAGLLASVETKQAESTALAETQTQETLAALGQDIQLITDLKTKGLEGLDRDASHQLMMQDADQQALLNAFFQGTDGEQGDTVLYLAKMLQLRLHRQRLPQVIPQIRTKVLAVDNVQYWPDLEAIGHTQNANFWAQPIADRLWEAFDWGTDEDKAYEAVKGLTPEQGKAVRGVYQDHHGEDLDARVDSELSAEEFDRVHYALDGKKADADAAALRDAVKNPGTDEDLINTVLRGKTAEERKAIEESYRTLYKEDLKTRLGEELSGDDEAITNAHLVDGNTEKADAIQIKVAKDAFWGPDHEKIEGVYNVMRSEATQLGDSQGWTSAQIDAEIARRGGKMQTEYKGVTDSDLLVDLEQAFSPPTGQGSPQQNAYAEQYWQGRRDLVLGMASGDLTRADAGKLQIERTGFYADDTTINKILSLQYERALEREKRDAIAAYMASHGGNAPSADDRAKLEAEAANKALKTSKKSMDALGNYVETNYTKGATSFEDTIKDLTQGLEEEKATALMEDGGHLDDWEILRFATEGGGTDDDAFKNLLKSKKTKEEIQALEKEWQKNGHPGQTLAALIEDETSGRLKNDLLLDYEYGGEPKDPAVIVAKAEKQLDFEKRSGGVTIGPDGVTEVKSHEYMILEKRLATLQQQKAEYEQAMKLPKDDPRRAWQDLKWQATGAGFQSGVQMHRTMVDQRTELVAQVASMVAAITVGVAISVLTGGTATIAFIALMSSLAGTATSIGAKVAMKGAAYGADELGMDLALGAVDAFISVATAGVGDKLLKNAIAAAKLGGPGAKSLLTTLGRMAEGSMAQRAMANAISEGAEGFLQSLPTSLLGTALDERTWTEGNPLVNLLMGTGTGVAMGTFTSGAIGGLTNLKKAPPAALAPEPRSSGSMAALLDAHKNSTDLEARYFEVHPDRNKADFQYDLDGVLLKRAEHDPEVAASLQKRMRDDIAELLPQTQKQQFSNTPVEMWDAKRFEDFTGSTTGQAVVTVKDGQPTVIVKQGADPLKLAEEGFHLVQTLDTKTKAKIAHLDEAKLATWPRMDTREKFPVYKHKIELEIDAQERMIAALELRTASGSDNVAARLVAAKNTLANLERRLGEVDRIGPFQRTLMAWSVLKEPQWLDQPPRLFAKSIDDIRAGIPGKVRSVEELPDADVVRVLNDGLPHFTPDDVEKIIIEQFPEQQEAARKALAAVSGFASLDSFTKLADKIRETNLVVYRPGKGSLADNLLYFDSKGIFGAVKLKRAEHLGRNVLVILDDVVLHKIATDPVFKMKLKDCTVLHPHGFVGGINMFTPRESIADRIKEMLDAKIQLDAPLDKLPEGHKNVINFDPAEPGTTNAELARALSSKVGLEPGFSIQKMLLDAKIKEQYHDLIKELLVHQSKIRSLPAITSTMKRHHNSLMKNLPEGIEDVYYYLPEKNRSFVVLAMAHRSASGTPVDKYIEGPADLAKLNLGSNSAIIILDDMAGTGGTMKTAAMKAKETGYEGYIMLAPLMGTEQAKDLFEELVLAPGGKIRYHPLEEISSLLKTSFYNGLEPAHRKMIEDAVGNRGIGENALSVAFPYMSPNNNNELFGWLFAKYFILNRRDPLLETIKTYKAVKTYGYHPPEIVIKKE